jgi:hypothetical protein
MISTRLKHVKHLKNDIQDDYDEKIRHTSIKDSSYKMETFLRDQKELLFNVYYFNNLEF